jgi:hypothetical protein
LLNEPDYLEWRREVAVREDAAANSRNGQLTTRPALGQLPL